MPCHVEGFRVCLIVSFGSPQVIASLLLLSVSREHFQWEWPKKGAGSSLVIEGHSFLHTSNQKGH